MLPFLAFSFTGLLIGVMVAFSEDHLSKIVVPLLFAVFGGSITAFGKNLADSPRREAYAGLLALSLFCTIGIIIGVVAVEYRWLSPVAPVNGPSASAPRDRYLRAQTNDAIHAIEVQVRQGQMSKQDAYDKLISIFIADR
jgi:hypothetical protein